MKTIVKMLCPHCGSDDICRDASAKWDAQHADWVMSGVQDTMTCQACDTDFDEAREDEVSVCEFDDQEHATVLAALRYYQQQGMGDPKNRTDDIHDIATDGDNVISMDAAGIDALCEKLNFDEDEF